MAKILGPILGAGLAVLTFFLAKPALDRMFPIGGTSNSVYQESASDRQRKLEKRAESELGVSSDKIFVLGGNYYVSDINDLVKLGNLYVNHGKPVSNFGLDVTKKSTLETCALADINGDHVITKEEIRQRMYQNYGVRPIDY
jgi:hypothetical protein